MEIEDGADLDNAVFITFAVNATLLRSQGLQAEPSTLEEQIGAA